MSQTITGAAVYRGKSRALLNYIIFKFEMKAALSFDWQFKVECYQLDKCES